MNLGNVQFWWFLWDFYKRRVVLIIARRVEYLIGGILVLGHHSIGPSGLFFFVIYAVKDIADTG
jgi:hypothetical protein